MADSTNSSEYEKASTIGDRDLPLSSDLNSIIADLQKFSSSSSTSAMVREVVLDKKRQKFLAKMRPILNKIKDLSPNQKQLQNITLFLLQALEDYIYCSEAERCQAMKGEIAMDLLKPFVNDDENLTAQIIDIMSSKVKPSTMWRRNKKQLYRFGRFFLLNSYSGAK